MKFYSMFRSGETSELAGVNFNIRPWPVFANDVIAVKSLKPAQFILFWSGHSSGSFGAVLSDKWASGREEFWVLGLRTGKSNRRSRIFFPLSPTPNSPHPNYSKTKKSGNQPHCYPVLTGETVFLLVFLTFCPYFTHYLFDAYYVLGLGVWYKFGPEPDLEKLTFSLSIFLSVSLSWRFSLFFVWA